MRDQVFVSYSHGDDRFLKRLKKHMAPDVRAGLDVWDDTRIKPGQQWRDEIRDALARARVAVLLLSADFISSEFVNQHELPALLRAAKVEGLTILWIAVGPADYEAAGVAEFQAAHDIKKPLALYRRWADIDAQLVPIARKIRQAFDQPTLDDGGARHTRSGSDAPAIVGAPRLSGSPSITEWFYKATPKKVSYEETRELACNEGFLCRSAYARNGSRVSNIQYVECGNIIHVYFVRRGHSKEIGSFEVIPPDRHAYSSRFGKRVAGTALFEVDDTFARRLQALGDASGERYQADPKLNKITGWPLLLRADIRTPPLSQAPFARRATLVKSRIDR